MAGFQNFGDATDKPVGINVAAVVAVIVCLCLYFLCSFHFHPREGKIEAWLPFDRSLGPGELMKGEISVVLNWDPATGRTVHQVRHQEPAVSAEEMMVSVREIADGYKRAGDTVYPLVIDSAPDVPWKDVVHVMDLCKVNSIDYFRFAARRRGIDDKP